MQLKHKRRLVIGLGILLILLLYLARNLSFLIKIVALLFGILIFNYVDHSFNIKFKREHYAYVLIILAAGIFLSPLYYIATYYDKILHLTMPILAAMLVFFIVDKLKISLKWKLLLTSACVLGALTIHEIGEYIFDVFLDLKMQGVYLRDYTGLVKYTPILSRIDDTMQDLILGLLGIAFFTIGKTIKHLIKIKDKERKIKHL